MSYEHSLAHTKWNCKYHIVFAPKYRRKGCGKNRGAHQNRMEENRAGKHLTMLE
mgnify:FL=1